MTEYIKTLFEIVDKISLNHPELAKGVEGIGRIRRTDFQKSPYLSHKVDLVFDIGANVGQFSSELRKSGYRGRIVSIEPLEEEWSLCKSASSRDEFWTLHDRCALGASFGEVEINKSENSISSSILDMKEKHLMAAPKSKFTGKAQTKLVTLDSIFDQYVKIDDVVAIKIDVQGYEEEVLKGAAMALGRTKLIQIELSLVELYDGAPDYKQMIDKLSGFGFELWQIVPGFWDGRTGQLLQFDGFFVRD